MKPPSSRLALRLSVLSLMVLLVFLIGGSAFAQRRYPPGPPAVLPTLITRTVEPKPTDDGTTVAGTRFHASPETEQAAESEVLPFTGADVTLFALGGAAAVAAGTTLLRIGRRRNR
ncbi:MAG TPA: hypothetical protein VG929_07105 [Actinomycetota bacterium]|nr:hypothetical protein [Actinomycetota bacterium]